MSELKVASCYEFEKVLRGKSNKLFYPKSEVDAAIAELKAKLEDVQATAYAESVDAGMENRRLKRALWLARGYIMTLLNRDFQRLAYQCNNGDYKKNLLRRRNRYYELSEKCLKKAEEFV